LRFRYSNAHAAWPYVTDGDGRTDET
jgi:hypothetical protein